MNSIPEMKPAMLQTPGSDFNYQNTYPSDKTEFASIVNKEYSKSTDCKSRNNEIRSEGDMKENDGSNADKSACNDCATDINSKVQNNRGNNKQHETDDIESVYGDEENTDAEDDLEKVLKPDARLFSLINGYMAETKNASQVSTDNGNSDTDDIGAGGPEGESASENGLNAGTLLNNLLINYAGATRTGLNIAAESDQGHGLTDAESSDVQAESGLNVVTVLNNPVSSDAAETKEVSSINPGDKEGDESREAGPDTQGKKGVKMEELLNRLVDRSEEKENNKDLIQEKMATSEKTIDINSEADGPDVNDLHLKKGITLQPETKNEVSGHIENKHTDNKTAGVHVPANNNNSEGLNTRLMSGSSGQDQQGNGAGDDAFNFTKGQHNPGNDTELNNVASLNASNTSLENARSIQGPSLHTVKMPGVQELLDNIIYVIKGNSRMGVSVEHENLGKLNISLSMEKGMVNVHINASDRAVREIIENNIQHIIDSLNKDGVSVGEFSVGLRDRREQETNIFSSKNGQGGIIPQKIKKENRCSGLVNIFA